MVVVVVVVVSGAESKEYEIRKVGQVSRPNARGTITVRTKDSTSIRTSKSSMELRPLS